MGIWKKGKTQQSGGVAGEIPTGCKEKKNPNESAWTLEEGAQGACDTSSLRDFQNLIGKGLSNLT